VFSSAGFMAQLVVQGGTVGLGVAAGIGTGARVPVARGTWNIFELDLNYTTQTASGFVNGTFVGSGPFATPSTDLTSTAIGINGSPGTDLGFFDALSVASPALSVSAGGVVSTASYTAPVAPGSIASAFGNFLLTSSAAFTSFPAPTNLLGLSLQLGSTLGTPAPLFFASVGQVNRFPGS
jgi:hypothetical protein